MPPNAKRLWLLLLTVADRPTFQLLPVFMSAINISVNKLPTVYLIALFDTIHRGAGTNDQGVCWSAEHTQILRDVARHGFSLKRNVYTTKRLKSYTFFWGIITLLPAACKHFPSCIKAKYARLHRCLQLTSTYTVLPTSTTYGTSDRVAKLFRRHTTDHSACAFSKQLNKLCEMHNLPKQAV